MEIANGVELIDCASSKFHRFLYREKNIGINAENLTIVILSYNRIEATIKLIESVKEVCPEFKGKILIGDNGSTANNIKALNEFIEKEKLEIKLIEFGENLGVAKGRNASVKHVETEWLMFLDNDIYFIDNIFPDINRTIEQLGCKFVNLALLDKDKKTLFSYGGNIFVTPIEHGIHIGCGSTYKQMSIKNLKMKKPCLASFLFGGCSVVNKKTFEYCGGFDENMKIGFEDIDFSIKIFNEGLKIGCCNKIGLVHNHEKTQSKDDVEYEKIRFSSKTLIQSAKYLEKKYNLKIWNDETEKWLKQREFELGLSNENGDLEEIKTKPKIVLVVDVRNWALDNIAHNIVKHLGHKYDFKIIYMEDVPDSNIVLLFYACLGADVIHFLWRGLLTFLTTDSIKAYLEKYGRGYEAYKREVLDYLTITTSVYDHTYLSKEDFYQTKTIFQYISAYTVSSKKLYDIYKKLNLRKPFVEITDGVDLEKFYPINIERLENKKDKELIIGWVGNSEWSGDPAKDHKGLNNIIRPAIDELIKEGYKIKLELTDKQEKLIPHDEMANFYSKIDVYVCASLNEGTPNPVLEAMACGVPVISTDVGIVPEVFGEKQRKYLLEERTKDCLKSKIKEFIQNMDKIKELSDENLLQIKEWSWENKCKQFDEFFSSVLKKKK